MSKSFLLFSFLLLISFTITAQTKKYWTMKVDPSYSQELKKLFEGKRFIEGENRVAIDDRNMVKVLVKKGKVVNLIFISSVGSTTITTDYAKAIANNQQPLDHCEAQRYLCQVQCRLGGIPDPMHGGTCLEQCEMAYKVCPYLPRTGFAGFGGFVLQ